RGQEHCRRAKVSHLATPIVRQTGLRCESVGEEAVPGPATPRLWRSDEVAARPPTSTSGAGPGGEVMLVAPASRGQTRSSDWPGPPWPCCPAGRLRVALRP